MKRELSLCGAVLEMFVIYDHPKDYPRHFVVRRTFVRGGGPEPRECELANTLDEARALVPQDCDRIARFPEDDPVIVETWL